MRRQWQRLPNWTSATLEGLTWEGTAELRNGKRTLLELAAPPLPPGPAMPPLPPKSTPVSLLPPKPATPPPPPLSTRV
ncbi:hypothetical protein M378DRAFT_157397 [Amanita muscaria Koide BX008]|uniref:Uncharacterized protein n=1 Tax=Amanita muscaria (strain Koide BX008) TaxID=946122 RepID=A0A0C2TPM0_AMAMK|nr:hypothetical protein M378DRAFT_157397 [Amanita muscaria Koide BX008]